MASICVVLVHSTDEPDLAVAGMAAAHAAAVAGRPAAMYLAVEGARIAALGVAETLASGGRPDVKALLDGFEKAGGRILVSAPCWRERGFADDALVPGARLVEPIALSDLAAEGFSFASF